jgi:hypothetical protein
VSQYFVHFSSNRSPDDRGVAQRAGRALDKLRPSCSRTRLNGPHFDAWVVQDLADPSPPMVARSIDGALDIIVAGAWFIADPGVSSIESLLACFVRDGIDQTALSLEGPFAIVLHDRVRHVLNVVTDIAGTLHVFVAEDRNGWMISTSSSWLAAMGTGELDPIAVHEFIATGIVYEDRTLWQGVRKVGQAQVATFAATGDATKRTYWSFADIAPERDDISTSVERVTQSLKEAAAAIGRRYPRVLCDITGGYDSRATIAGFMMAHVPFSGTVSGPENSPDVTISTAIAAYFGIPHHRAAPQLQIDRFRVEDACGLTDGEYDAVEYARIAAIHREHARTNDISVNGSFGELARGYWWELLWPAIGECKPLDNVMLARRRFAAARYDTALFAGSANLDLISHMTGVIARVNETLKGMPNTALMDHAYFGMRMHRWQGRIASSTSRIWPTVSPFAFRSVLAPVLEARASSRLRSLLIRTLLARNTPALARFPLEAGHPALPVNLSNVHRFWPIVPHYGRKVAAKLMPGKVAISTASLRPAGFALSPTELELLLASGMFATDRLHRFIAESAQTAQYSRLLTLGLGLAKVTSARMASN